MNNVVLIGRLARDPELSYTPNTQTAVARFTLAVDRPRRNGEDQGADFIRIQVWGRQAENADRYLSKGRQVAIHGRIQTGSYKNRDGETVYTTDVVADNVEYLGGGQQQQQHQTTATYTNPQTRNIPPEATRTSSQPQTYGAHPQTQESQVSFNGFDDLPDTFSASEDDIPF